MDINLTGQPTIKHEYSFSSGNITVTFKDASDTVLGSIEIEEVRFRPLMQVLKSISEEVYDDFALYIQRSRSNFNKNERIATTEFFA